MCDQQRLRPACAYAQSDQSLCWSLEYSVSVKLLTEHNLKFLYLKEGCTGSSESTHVKTPHCWKSHVTVLIIQLEVHFNNLCRRNNNPCKRNNNPCKRINNSCKRSNIPCKQNDNPCKRNNKSCKRNNIPCKRNNNPCKRNNNSCKRNNNPC